MMASFQAVKTATGCRKCLSSAIGRQILRRQTAHKSRFLTTSATEKKKRHIERDVIVSVLEAAATKRDAKGYLQKYTNKKPGALSSPAPEFVQGKESDTVKLLHKGSSNIAIVKLRAPDRLDDATIDGVARTLDQLRMLGLLSVVVLDCGKSATVAECNEQASRLSDAIDSFGKPGSRLASHVFARDASKSTSRPSFLADQIKVQDFGALQQALRHGLISIIPPLASPDATRAPEPTNPDDLVLGLTRYFTGLQLQSMEPGLESEDDQLKPTEKIASVERVIILDPFGGPPVRSHPDRSHRFINLEHEFEPLKSYFLEQDSEYQARKGVDEPSSPSAHAANLQLAKEALSILPSTSSALIATPAAAANVGITQKQPVGTSSFAGFTDMVTTRRKQNPLLYNLLTDKPVYSSSLPVQRMQPDTAQSPNDLAGTNGTATLVKRGMPLTIFPDPRITPWQPPKPGSPRLRLTDRCIDLPRLMYLIEDSFNRKIDVQDYLNRVNENLAGVIIAGEYEGGAILTWERPAGMSEEEAYETGHMVPYLDKFAVLKSRQGSGGVADIVFNAMVQDCFPDGVCWRSRKDNPVNKWYFERSRGTGVVAGTNWKMFWTTPGFVPGEKTHQDYEAVCRGVEPSWADNKHILE
ncbi:NAT, n-acetyltransferase, of n-acetylglutamate synthase domain-containing protein [Sarocladium implicatum]|nr:NAT, n-acetyltransferase, of n-acetylglutamate synthase domain-containing protein [Sarocladium implicatum]